MTRLNIFILLSLCTYIISLTVLYIDWVWALPESSDYLGYLLGVSLTVFFAYMGLNLTTWQSLVNLVTRLNKKPIPQGLHWENDGCCWKCIESPESPRGWDWEPVNQLALRKGKPNSELTDFYWPENTSRT